MATIPLGNYGQAQARPGPMVGVQQGDPIGQAVAGVNRVGQAIVGDIERQRLEKVGEEKKTAEAQQRAKVTLDLARAGNDLHAAHDDVAQRVRDGSVPPDDAQAEFEKVNAKIKASALEGLHDPVQQATVDAHLTGITGALSRQLVGTTQKQKQFETASVLDQMGEEMERSVGRSGPDWASQKFNTMVDFTGQAAGLNPAQMAKLKQAKAEKFHGIFFSRAGEAAFEGGDVASLQALRGQLAGPDGDKLDPTQRTQLSHQFFTMEKQIEGQRGREQDAATKLAVNSVQGLAKFVDDGMAPDIPYQNEVRMLTKGTPWEAQANALIERGIAGAGFGAQSLPRQEAMLAAQAGQATNPEGAAKLAHARSIYERQSAAYREDPWDAGARFQRLPTVVAQTIMAPLQLLKIATDRLPMMNSLEAASGQPVPLLRPAEVPQAIAALQSASIRERTEILGQLGGMLDPKRQAALADMLDKGDDSLSLTLKLGSDKTTAGRMVSELVQIGKQAIGDKTVKKDETALSGWKAEIAGIVRGTLGDPKAEDEVIRSAYYVRAAQELDGAKTSGFTRGFGSGAEDALAMVIGKPLDRGGVKTFLPRGMTVDQFDTKAREALATGAGQTVYSRGVPIKVEEIAWRLPGYGMRMTRPGQYMPTVNNAPFTIDKEGQQPLRLQVQ